jgi:hypothetical protein
MNIKPSQQIVGLKNFVEQLSSYRGGSNLLDGSELHFYPLFAMALTFISCPFAVEKGTYD